MELTIEKLIYGGDGLSRGPADERGQGKAVFVPFVLAGERVDATVVEQKPGFLRARADRILQPSPERIEPGCPYFLSCGGCHYQHAGYEHQLEIKRGILRETVQRLAKIEPPEIVAHPSQPWQYRNRTRLKVRTTPDFAIGYHRMNSHDLLGVEQCPISSPLINRAIRTMWQLGRERLVSSAVMEIEFFANAEDDRLLVELSLPDQYWKRPSKPTLTEFVSRLREAMPEIAGVAAFRMTRQGAVREKIPGEFREAFGDDQLTYTAGGHEYHVSAGSFFQTNRYLADTLIKLVTGGHSGATALDLYAGAGLFTLPLSQNFGQVWAVEIAPYSSRDLKRNAPSNVTAFRQTTEEFLKRHAGELADPVDLIVVDPPRAGLGERVTSSLAAMSASRITYVSCNPSTLARDLKGLLAAGFRIESMDLIDLFPQTFHIESITRLVR